jgi:hypothetical protein
MKEKADTPEKKEQHQVGVIRASRAMNQSNYMASGGGQTMGKVTNTLFTPFWGGEGKRKKTFASSDPQMKKSLTVNKRNGMMNK